MKILIVGDFCLNGRASKMNQEELNASLQEVKDAVMEADYAMANLECAVFDSVKMPIKKIGSNLCSDSKALCALKDTGFSCLALANNHFADFGNSAVEESLNLIDNYGFDRVGAGKDIYEAKKTLFVQVKGKRLAIINCCEHEFTISDKQNAGCNPLDPIGQYKAIIEARKQADFVIVMVHGGSENYPLPTPRMQQVYRYYVDVGADVIVNCHQHCYSGYEIYKERPIFYGLGNFFFDWPKMRNCSWNEGYMLRLDFSGQLSFEMIPYFQCDGDAKIRLFSFKEKSEFESKVKELNVIIQDEEALNLSFSRWVEKCSRDYFWAFRKSVPRWRRYLNRLGWLGEKENLLQDTYLNSEMIITLLSYIRCESHRDVFVELLKRITELRFKNDK